MEDKQKGGTAVMEAPAKAPERPAEAAQTPEILQKAEAAQVSGREEHPAEAAPVEAAVEEKKIERTFLYRLIVGLYGVVAKVLFRMKIEGAERVPKGACVLMGNHQCILDPVTLALCTPDREIRFMGKKELFENPVLRWLFTKVHGFPVDRGNIDMTAIRTAMNVLKEGNTLGIFPEGTRSKTGHMGPLLGGASLLALRSGCDVVPVYIDGRYRPLSKIVVHVGEPVDVADLRAGRITKESCEELTRRMEAEFALLSGGKSRPAQAEKAD